MKKIDNILKHTQNLKVIIIVFSVLFLSYCILNYGFHEVHDQLFGNHMKSIYFIGVGLPITGYGIWYVLQVAPMRQVSKTNKVLGLLFFGIIGKWILLAFLIKLPKKLKEKDSKFNFCSEVY
ncbi:MAG: hypothetical protein ABF274_00825 [Nonlabens sp.]|uniref:hypothetical protein n=2 Tax=Nonlabens sp. TaxID=1888209 RepID=UPI00321B0C7A